jgi:hypothetical protein
VFGSFASTLSTFLSDVDVAIVVGQQRRYNTARTADNKHKRWKGDAALEDRSSERSAEQSAGGKFFGDTPLGRTGLDCIEAWQSGVSDSSSSSSSSSSGDDSSGSDSEAEEECNGKSGNGSSGHGSSSNAKSGSSSSSAEDALAHTARYATALLCVLPYCTLYKHVLSVYCVYLAITRAELLLLSQASCSQCFSGVLS